MGKIHTLLKGLAGKAGRISGKVNWKLVLALGIAFGAASLLYHTWRFMALAGL